MYVCLCHAVTEDDIRDAVRQGAGGLAELRERLSLATSCGACVSEARACLDRELDKVYAAQKEAA